MGITKLTPHFTDDRVGQLLVELYEHQALLLVGLVTNRRLPDSLTWDLVRILDASFRRTKRQLTAKQERGPEAATDPPAAPHPAIAEFLRQLRATNQLDVTKRAAALHQEV